VTVPEVSPARRWIDRGLAALARRVLGIFYRAIEVEGIDRLPRDRPLVVVANHTNALIDGALLAGWLPEMPRFLAKSTLWDVPPLVPLLRLAAVTPVYRRHEADPARNAETFARCHDVLAAGGTVALFPEGASHVEPALLPLKTGAARIVLGAEAERGPLGLRVVPVGLVFDVRGRFRSRALIRVGEPIDPLAAAGEGWREQAPDAVRALTEAIERGLAEVTPNFDSWEQARLVGRAAEVLAHGDPDLPLQETLGKGFDARRAALVGYRELERRHPERVRAVAAEVAAYEALLAAAGVRDRQVAARYPLPGVARWLARTLVALAGWLPLAVIGTVLNLVPYLAVTAVARAFGNPEDQRATFKVLPALALYPLTWALEAWAAARLAAAAGGEQWALAAALATLAAGPLTGFAALAFHDRRRRLQAEAKAFLTLRTRRRLAAELRRRREAVRRGVGELAELYRRES
jgi:1-acyl-sn-glycerol-3-phosphate acyltransferase